jgi:hypothetical protein
MVTGGNDTLEPCEDEDACAIADVETPIAATLVRNPTYAFALTESKIFNVVPPQIAEALLALRIRCEKKACGLSR